MVLFCAAAATALAGPLEDKALFEAVSKNDLRGVQAALAAGANPNSTNAHGSYPLLSAAYSGEVSILKALLTAGADVHVKDKDGNTAVMWACYKGGDAEGLKLLLQYKPDVNAVNSDGMTALHGAASTLYPSGSAINLLLKAGADINARDSSGHTLLISLSYCGMHLSAPLMESLIKKGADVNLRTTNGATALMIASGNAYDAAVKILIKYKADPRAVDNDGNTALHYCAPNGASYNVVALLVKAGARLDQKNKAGRTLKDLAAQHYNNGVLQAIRDLRR